ncbi:hypothetical protein COL516b_008256 [Colletotrichum fioriniae]|nr:uncharacterized protein COL516b_008256 [Colletotrichum fioriniae]KAJ0300685.1 hypothetical protein COL516b_008256 [Colletotrichum fioriniae]
MAASPYAQCVNDDHWPSSIASTRYTKTLHERIRKLEQACTLRGIDINTLEATVHDVHGSAADNISSAARGNRDFTVPDASTMETSDDQAAEAAAQLPSPYSSVGVDSSSEARRVTAMGTILAEDDLEDSPNNPAEPDFYGSSSAVAFLKEAYSAMKSVPARVQSSTPFRTQQALPSFSTPSSLYADFDKFLLPPRPFADYLLQLYFQRVHYLYPVFHRPAFERAYESLWQPTTSAAATAAAATSGAGETDFRGVGLGCSPGADAATIVFHSALNSIFALACNFADLTCAEKAKSIEVFLLRSRKCLSVDLLEKNNLGVVQTLLLCGLVFQGTPFPDRCWNAVGIACRIAQGLGLHMDVVAARDMGAGGAGEEEEEEEEEGFTLEMDVRQRTWQGCVVLDTSYSGADQSLEQPKLEFITQSFKLSLILGNILSQVYQPWRNRHPTQRASCGTRGGGGVGGLSFDAIVELDSKLTDFEDSVPPLLSWGPESDASVLDGASSPDDLRILATQKHVLHARFLYLRLMLHRPILTDLSAAYARPHRDATGGPSTEAPPRSQGKGLRAPFLTECARVCVDAAMQLIDLVQGSYQTDTTGAWWWNSLYACAAGLVLIVCRLCPRLWTGLDHAATSASWEKCQSILLGIAAFSVSARKSLDLLRKIDGAVTQLQAGENMPREPSGQQIDSEMNCARLAESWSLPANIDVSLLLEPDPMSFFRGWEVMGYEASSSG